MHPVYPDGERGWKSCFRLYPYENQEYSLFGGIRSDRLNRYDRFIKGALVNDRVLQTRGK